MTAEQKAEALAIHAEAMLRTRRGRRSRMDNAMLIEDLCCLTELLRVAEKAEVLLSNNHGDMEIYGRGDLRDALRDLRNRLSKGVEI